jgi:hypothetical protein
MKTAFPSSVNLLRLIVALSCIVAAYQTFIFYIGLETSDYFEELWNFSFVGLLVTWLYIDSENRPEIYRPSFDYGLFVFAAWVFYLPYYLIRTRGRSGWLWVLGLAVLAFLGPLLQLAIYFTEFYLQS